MGFLRTGWSILDFCPGKWGFCGRDGGFWISVRENGVFKDGMVDFGFPSGKMGVLRMRWWILDFRPGNGGFYGRDFLYLCGRLDGCRGGQPV